MSFTLRTLWGLSLDGYYQEQLIMSLEPELIRQTQKKYLCRKNRRIKYSQSYSST